MIGSSSFFFFDRELFPVRLTNTGAFNLTKYGEQARRDGVSVRSGTGDFTRRLRLRRLGDDDGDTDNGDVEDILLKYFFYDTHKLDGDNVSIYLSLSVCVCVCSHRV